MSAADLAARNRWAVAVAGAIGVLAAFLFLVRVPTLPVALPAGLADAPKPPLVRMARPGESDRLLQEETELRDLRPLFLPTERNAALPDPRLEPGLTLLDDDTLTPTFPHAEIQVGQDLPAIATLNGIPVDQARPRDALAAEGPEMSLLGFGRAPVTVRALTPRGGFVEVTDTRDGSQVLAQALPVEARPPTDKAWSPLEFLAVVNPAGLGCPLALTESSRVEEVDVHFRNFLTRQFRIGERFDPGFYRIVIAP